MVSWEEMPSGLEVTRKITGTVLNAVLAGTWKVTIWLSGSIVI
jgi:hypothetical protein